MFSSVWRGCTPKRLSDTDELGLTSQSVSIECPPSKVSSVAEQNIAGHLHHKGQYSHVPFSYSLPAIHTTPALLSLYKVQSLPKSTAVKHFKKLSFFN